jgi:hypothetical protein
MADPLSIAGSVVGITAAGVQASVRLYALAEKVATASQRVTSIADDISSTCAILNQVRELIIPQPDAHGTLRSVFNSVALNDISHALGRCRSAFTDIDTLLRRAFEQVGKRPTMRSNIELSRFERAKWPFLQPQFDDLRNDLRDAKGNLVLMIAVASLALAQRDGRQRPIHETERLELGSTIIQLHQARPIDQYHRKAPEEPRQRLEPRESFGNPSGITSDQYAPFTHTPRSESANSVTVLTPNPLQNNRFASLSSNKPRGLSPPSTGISLANVSLALVGDTRSPEQEPTNRPSPSIEDGVTASANLDPASGDIASSGREIDRALGLSQDPSTPDRSGHQNFTPQTLSSKAALVTQPGNEQSTEIIGASNDDETRHYAGWTTNHGQGLATGYGNSVTRVPMSLSQKSLKGLVKAYTDQGHDPHIAMSELTEEQQKMIIESYTGYLEPEVVYVRLQRNITVPSVFGMLNVETFKWVIASRVSFQPHSRASGISPRRKSRHGPPAAEVPEPTDSSPSVKSGTYLVQARRPSGSGSRPSSRDGSSMGSADMVFVPPPPRPTGYGNLGGISMLPPPPMPPPPHANNWGPPRQYRQPQQQQGYDPSQYRNYPHNMPPPPGPPLIHKARNDGSQSDEETLPQADVGENGQDIVNELLARWTKL